MTGSITLSTPQRSNYATAASPYFGSHGIKTENKIKKLDELKETVEKGGTTYTYNPSGNRETFIPYNPTIIFKFDSTGHEEEPYRAEFVQVHYPDNKAKNFTITSRVDEPSVAEAINSLYAALQGKIEPSS